MLVLILYYTIIIMDKTKFIILLSVHESLFIYQTYCPEHAAIQ